MSCRACRMLYWVRDRQKKSLMAWRGSGSSNSSNRAALDDLMPIALWRVCMAGLRRTGLGEQVCEGDEGVRYNAAPALVAVGEHHLQLQRAVAHGQGGHEHQLLVPDSSAVLQAAEARPALLASQGHLQQACPESMPHVFHGRQLAPMMTAA